MRFINRGSEPVPASLVNGNLGSAELIDARTYYVANPPPSKAYEFKTYSSDDVKQALQNLFHGKCAYCESFFAGTQPADVEHYRPKGGIQESPAHPGYWWLAMEWSNLLPSCIDCNRRRRQVKVPPNASLAELNEMWKGLGDPEPGGKQNSFPTADQVWADPENDPEQSEQPLLIDPTRTDPKAHLVWRWDELPVVLPVVGPNGEDCPRAVASIFVYALDRVGLVQGRLQVLQSLKAQIELIRALMDNVEGASPAKKAALILKIKNATETLKGFCGENRPHSAFAEAVVSEFEQELVKWLNP